MSIPDFSLEGKTALVTGGGKGIGKSIALTLAEAGADVAVLSRTKADLDKVVKEIKKRGKRGLAVPADVTKVTEVYGAVEKVLETFQKIDILVNSAGINITKYAVDYTEEDWDKVINTNLKGSYFMCQAVGKKTMIPQKRGKIINIASQMAFVGYYKRTAYCASKGGLVQLTKALAIEWADYNINVNAVAPTFIETPMTKPMFEDKDFYNEVLSRIPLGRLGKTKDVDGAVLYLASSASDLVTGHTLVVDGGWTVW